MLALKSIYVPASGQLYQKQASFMTFSRRADQILNPLIDAADTLLTAQSADDAWLKSVALVKQNGGNALNVVEIETATGAPIWFRSSMRLSSITAIALAFGLAACETAAPMTEEASSATRLATQADMAAIAGKTLTLEPGKSYVIGADGTIKGSWGGAALVGQYEMKDGFFCRTLSQGPSGPAPEDCQILLLEGDTLRGTRDRGDGASFALTVS